MQEVLERYVKSREGPIDNQSTNDDDDDGNQNDVK
jgi:hypothetical protein